MMKYSWLRAVALGLPCFAALAGCHHRPAVRAAIVQSNFIFEGKVQQVGGSTLPEYFKAPPQSSLVVLVTKAFTGEIQEFEGQTVTVILVANSPVQAGSVRVGQTLTFLANPLVYADTLGVEGQARKPSAELEQEARRRPDLLFEDRIRLAEVIVEGTVRFVDTPPKEEGYVPEGPKRRQVRELEHNAEWTRATVNVLRVIRGGSLRQVYVYFPGSRDVVWYGAPQFHAGQSGTWLLHRKQIEENEAPQFVALHPLDFQEGSTQRETIRALANKNARRPDKTSKDEEIR